MSSTSLILQDSPRTSRGRVRLLICGLLAVTLLPAATRAQGIIDKRFQVVLQPQFGVVRGHAPLALSVALRWSSPQLIEGRLQLDWYVHETRLGRYVTSDLALSDSVLQFDVLLPPVILPFDEATFSVQARFIASDGTLYNLDVHDVALQPDWRRILLVAVCTTPGPAAVALGDAGPRTRSNSLARGFRLEPFFESRFTKRELLVDDTEVDPDDVPDDPLQMTAFDLFVIPGESLTKLKSRQLEALLAWVRAGGSLCVIVDTAVPPSHLEWLNKLTGRDHADAAFLHAADDKVVPASDAFGGLSQHSLDYGRVVTILGDSELPEDQWKQAVLFLWKVREDRRHTARLGHPWRLDTPELRINFGMPSPLEPQRLWQQSDLTKLLLPESVRGLPLSTVGLVLAVFLLVIAPGDYYVLGWLKRRRWTWMLFPAVSLLFTGYTMWLARQHLGQTSYDHAITVVDLGVDGQPVRTSQFAMLYAASNRRDTSNLEHELMVPLDPVVDHLVRQMLEDRAPREYEQPWTFAGRLPQKYSIERDIQQWAPRMARRTTFGSSDVSLPTQAMPVTKLRLSRDRTQHLRTDPAIPGQIVSLAESITRRPPSGYFSVVSQLSPTCGGNWEDLSVLDGSSDETSVLVDVANPESGQYVIFRRLQRESD